MHDVEVILDCLAELRRFAEHEGKTSLIAQVDAAETSLLADVCADYYYPQTDDFQEVMMQVFPDIYRAHA